MGLHYKVITCLLMFVVLKNVMGKNCPKKEALSKVQVSTFKFSSIITEFIAKQSGNHFLVSPVSIWNLLRVMTKGTRGKTRSRITEKLQLPSKWCENEIHYDKLLQNITGSLKLEGGGLMVFDNNINIRESFIKQVKNSGMEIIVTQSFETPTQIADYINSKVKNATHGLITSVVDPERVQNIILILIDFMNFKGEWKTPFLKRETQEQEFYNEEKQPIGKVNMMFLNDKFKMEENEEIQAKVLEIPYASDRFSMFVILPLPNVSLHTVQQSMKSRTPDSIFQLGAESPVMVEMPRFKIDFNIDDLNGVLSDIGLSELFTSEADFSGITDHPIHLSGFSHKCVLEVTEEGTVASTVTEMEYEDRIGPPTFKANSPFMYMIVENDKKVPLFVGAYSKPSLY